MKGNLRVTATAWEVAQETGALAPPRVASIL